MNLRELKFETDHISEANDSIADIRTKLYCNYTPTLTIEETIALRHYFADMTVHEGTLRKYIKIEEERQKKLKKFFFWK